MGRLLSFLGGAAKSLANTIDQDRAEKQRAEDDDKRFKMNLSYAKAANAINIMQEQASKPADQRASGAPFLTAPGGYQQNTEIATPVEFDENYDVKKAAGWAPGPSVAVPDPNALDPYKAAMLEQKQLDRDARIEAAKIRGSRGGGSSRAEVGDDGLTAYQREQLKRTDAREERLGKQSSKGGERPDNIRKAWDDEAARTSALEGEALRSKAAQYGMDQRGLPTDDETLRSALMAQIDAQYGKRLESASKRGGDKQSEPSKPDSESPPVAGAKKAEDGNWYVQKNGKWFKVEA